MLILLTRLRGRTKIIYKDSLSLYLFIYISIVLLPLASIVLHSIVLHSIILHSFIFKFCCFPFRLLFISSSFHCIFSGFHFLLFYSYHSIFVIFFLSFFCSWRLSTSFLKNVYEVFECYLKSILLQFMG